MEEGKELTGNSFSMCSKKSYIQLIVNSLYPLKMTNTFSVKRHRVSTIHSYSAILSSKLSTSTLQQGQRFCKQLKGIPWWLSW